MVKQRNINLDLIRIIAAFMVLSVHIGQHIGENYDVGAKGVLLFFILSGYLAFMTLDRSYSTIDYYRNRLIRILPTYYFCLILLYLEDIALSIYEGTLTDAVTGQCGIKFLRYVFFLQCFTPSDNWYMWNNHGALWAMSSFVFFYIVAPLLFKAIKKTYIGIGMLLFLMMTRQWMIEAINNLFSNYPVKAYIKYYSSRNPITELYCFLLGAVLYVSIKESKQYKYIMFLLVFLIFSSMSWYKYEIIFVFMVAISVLSNSFSNNKKIIAITT